MMTSNRQLVALYTLVRRELLRMLRISTQVFLPPVMTTWLYFLIFGTVIGQRIGTIQGIYYAEFIAPGLIIMAVITNSYANVSSSLFSVRFQKSIEEMLVSPMHYSLLLLGYVLGGVLRGIIVAMLVYIVSCFFVDMDITHIPMTLLVVVLVAALFSLAGFTNGMLARNFDDVAIVPTFILGPLTYLGGIFYDTNMLSDFWRQLTLFNPIYYMVHAIRQAMISQHETNMPLAIGIICIILALLATLNLIMLKKGVVLHD